MTERKRMKDIIWKAWDRMAGLANRTGRYKTMLDFDYFSTGYRAAIRDMKDGKLRKK